jgi:transcriptional regulator with XRE-family HTH domain
MPFRRLKRLQVQEGLTWAQVAKMLGISVSLVMMLKRGERQFSEKTLYRLEQAEREIADRKSRAERVVAGLLAGEGSAAEVLEGELRKANKIEFQVEYSNPRAAKSHPKNVALCKPPEEGCAKLRLLFGETMDTAVVLLACLPETLRSERFISALTADSRVRLTNGALNLVIPEWRTLAAKGTASPGLR